MYALRVRFLSVTEAQRWYVTSSSADGRRVAATTPMKIKKVKTTKQKAKAASASPSKQPTEKKGVQKKKHKLELLSQLKAAAPEKPKPESALEKKRRKRSAKSAILGAVDGMKASLDELLEANEGKHKKLKGGGSDAAAPSQAMAAVKRQKLVAEETAHMQQVIQHPAFVADPFAALQEHLKNTVGQHGSKERKKEGREYQ